MGYLGMVGGPNPCADQIVSVYAAQPIAFRVSPYGVSLGDGVPNSVVPYLIDPATLEIEWREDLLVGPFSDRVTFAVALDDSTMVFHAVGPPTGGTYTSRLRVLTRSGITIAMSAEQQSVATLSPEATIIRLDSTHFLRRYTEPFPSQDEIVQVFSVSGSTISLVASTTIPFGPHTVSRDGGEAGTPTVVIGSPLVPFHYDGAATLHCYSPANFRVNAVPFSIAGGIVAPDLSWRSRDATNILGPFVGKEGSSECLLNRTTDTRIGFYDDGTQMHYVNSEPPGIKAGEFGERDGETSFGDYLAAHVFEFPPGTPVTGDPASLVSQSGTTLSYAPIGVIVRCPAITTFEIDGTAGPTRHDTALGAVSQIVSATEYLLWAFRW